MRFTIPLVLFLCCLQLSAMGQVAEHAAAFKTKSNKYFRFQYDNDFFTKSDEYYTQGIGLELMHPGLKRSPLNRLLLKAPRSECRYGITFDHFGYTPTSITSDAILYGDRPFCGNLAFSNFLSSKDTIHHRLISSAITLGIIGQGAGGKEMQETIHRWLNNTTPLGWQYQIRNDLILTYSVNYSKRLISTTGFLLNGAAEIKLGTHTNKLKAGLNFMAGLFHDPFSPGYDRKKFHCYLYGQLQPGIVAYDATLQGGLFNRSSPYTIAAADINRLTIQSDFGIVMSFGKFYLEYSQSILSKEFRTGHYHRWGGISVGVDL